MSDKPLRRIKPNPNDPGWKFPFASRAYIERLTRQFMSYNKPKKKSHWADEVLPANRKIRIPWESVPPHFRQRCQELFDRKVAEERAKGIPGWPTRGKIDSLRMGCTRAGRHYFNGENYARYCGYKRAKKMWLAWLEWNAQEERKRMDRGEGDGMAPLNLGVS